MTTLTASWYHSRDRYLRSCGWPKIVIWINSAVDMLIFATFAAEGPSWECAKPKDEFAEMKHGEWHEQKRWRENVFTRPTKSYDLLRIVIFSMIVMSKKINEVNGFWSFFVEHSHTSMDISMELTCFQVEIIWRSSETAFESSQSVFWTWLCPVTT